jgi:putative transposase
MTLPDKLNFQTVSRQIDRDPVAERPARFRAGIAEPKGGCGNLNSRGSVCLSAASSPGWRSEADATLIDKLHREFPFAGSRMLQGLRVQDGVKLGRLHIAALMKRMGIEAPYRKPNRSKPAPGHKIYPSLLRKRPVTRPNQVWAMNITEIPMARGFLSLAAVMDWGTRRVLAWRVSIPPEVDVCIKAVEEALARHGTPEIFNSDQGSQFTSTEVIKVLAAREIRISMDSKGASRDNVFVERLWRTIQYEEVGLRAYQRLRGPRLYRDLDRLLQQPASAFVA